jgi:starch synthase (maltosyl-transferring)
VAELSDLVNGEIGISMPVSDFNRLKRGAAPGDGNGGGRAQGETGASGAAPGGQAQPPARIRILDTTPQVDGGRFAVKRTVGERLDVSAEVFRDGHDAIRAVLRFRAPGSKDWGEAPMRWIDREVDGDRWVGSFVPDREGIWAYEVGAFTDHFATWHDEVTRKRAAGGEDLTSEVIEGAELLRAARPTAALIDGQRIDAALKVVEGDADLEAKLDAVLAPRLLEAVERDPERRDFVSGEPLSVEVEPASAPGMSSSRAPGAASTASARSCRASPSSAST